MIGSACILVTLLASACTSPTPVAPAKEPAGWPNERQTVDDMLLKAQVEGGRISTVSSSIAIERIEPLFSKREVRTGTVLYERSESAPPRFAVLFEQRLVGRRLEERRKHIVYDGRWLSEIDHEKKQVLRWELCGEDSDPTRLGGRFPLPVGQSREEVRKHFNVEVIAGNPEAGFLEPIAEGRELQGLRLVPRSNAQVAEEFTRIDIWYDTATWLPVGIETFDRKDNIRRVRLVDPDINPELDEAQRLSLQGSIPPGEDWSREETPCAVSPVEATP